MQQQLLIIGNGFDLACGLKSRYIDFFKACIEHDSQNYSRALETFGFWENLLCLYASKGIENYNWCNIEGIILETLWSLNFGDSDFDSPNTAEGIYSDAIRCAKCNQDPEEKASIIKDSIKKYLFLYCANFCYQNGFTNKDKTFNGKKRKALNSHLLLELSNLEKRFCNYLRVNFTSSYVVNAVNLLGQITGFSTIKFDSIEQMRVRSGDFKNLKNIHVLNFNYTDPLESITKGLCSFNNVHGKLCNAKCDDSCSSSSVIFGIDDKMAKISKADDGMRLFSKTYRTLFMSDTTENILPLNDRQIIIKFFGHSLSEADYSYFQSIFDYYGIYSNSKVSLEFFYASLRSESRSKTTDAVYRLINQYGLTLTNKDQGKNLMHKLILEKRIRIVKFEEYKCAESAKNIALLP